MSVNVKGSMPSLALALALALMLGCSACDLTHHTNKSLARPTFAKSSTMAAIQQRGQLVVGVKYDQPGFGYLNPSTKKPEGFDVEIADLIAQGIFGGTKEQASSKIRFVEAVSKDRERLIQTHAVDVVIATYTINDERKQLVDFAGPYLIGSQDVMIRANDHAIKNLEDLSERKVCTAKGSTSATNLKAKVPDAEITLVDSYSQCAQMLHDRSVSAITTDNGILAELAKESHGEFKTLGKNYSSEPYGIGLSKGDIAFRDFLNKRLNQIFGNGQWADAFSGTLAAQGIRLPQPPNIDRFWRS